MNGYRVGKSAEAIYVGPRKSRRLRRCDGHINPQRHMIPIGAPYVASALPPDSEIGNLEWWHHNYCLDCAPIEFAGGAA